MSAADRDAQQATVVELRRARLTFPEIGKRLTPAVTGQRAHQIYQAALARHPLTSIQVDEYRLEAVELADLAVRNLMTIALAAGSSARVKVEAWGAIRGWAEHLAKTTGTYVPTRTEVITIDAIDAQIAALEAEMGTRAALSEGADDVSNEIAQLEARLANGRTSP